MKILVLAGGASAERDVSLESGRCVADALRDCGHDVAVIDPQAVSLETLECSQWDVAVPMVHGTGGEDGTLQRQLDSAHLPYVGSSPEASELTFDKIRTNTLLASLGIAVPESVVVQDDMSLPETLTRIAELGEKVVTKPPRQGSSIGVSIADSPQSLREALDVAFQYNHECLVERFIAGRELTVAVVDGRPLPAIEIVPSCGWYDYAAKYVDDQTEYRFVPEDESQTIAEIARRACEICGVSGIARVDFRVIPSGEPWLLEINTIPGMTSHSLVPKAAARAGLTLGQLWESSIFKRLTTGG